MIDSFSLGTTPVEESCISATDFDKKKEARLEAIRYSEKLTELFDFLPNVWFKVTQNPHDFGNYLDVEVCFREEDIDEALFVEGHSPLTWEQCDSIEYKENLAKEWEKSVKIFADTRLDYKFPPLSREEIMELRKALRWNYYDGAEVIEFGTWNYLKLPDDTKLKSYIYQFYLTYVKDMAFMAEDDPNTVWLYWTDEMDAQIDDNGFHFLYLQTPLISEEKPDKPNEHIIMKAHIVDFQDVYKHDIYIVKSERI